MKSPTVSVIMATYNHASFVEQAIESVVRQRHIDFEFLISDDGSTDGTRDVVASVHDKRIRFFPNEENRGACMVTNELIRKARGEFIALINSDDYWIGDDKLAYQLQIMRDDPMVGASFGRACFVDEDGRTINKWGLPQSRVFDQENRSRGAWLRHFFDFGNCLCHPTMLIRKQCYETVGMYDNRLRQLPDFDMWVRLLKRYGIHVSEREMICFRKLPGENVSSATSDNLRRLLNETYFILQRFFDGISRDEFLEGFGDLLVEPDLPDEGYVDIEQALLYFGKDRVPSHIYNLIGIEKMHFLLGSDNHRSILINRYGIGDREFHSLGAGIGVFDLAETMGNLSIVSGADLIAEVKRRAILRAPSIVRRVLNRFVRSN